MAGRKIKYVKLLPGERAAKIRAMIDLLIKSQVVLPIFHSNCSGIPLGADIEDSVFKLAFLDVGLANHICGLDWRTLANTDDLHLINAGAVTEQFVAQQLAWLGKGKPELTYWLREGRSGNAEVDFTIAFGRTIYPIEVKSGKSGSLKSLQQFVLHKNVSQALRFDFNPPSRQHVGQLAKTADGTANVSYELLTLPLYAVEELPRLLADGNLDVSP